MDIDMLNRATNQEAALRRRQTLQPLGGKGDKIFPPIYPGEGRNAPPRHVYERRRLNGADVWCVLVDSVQSQANRLEECLLDAIREGVSIPYVEVDFREAQLDGLSKITSLDAPHRVYDAILRDSLYDGTPFMESELGKRLAKAKAEDASALLETSPTALLFGAWHSTGEGGGLGAKFARCLISEIIGIDVPVDEVVTNQRTGEIEAQTFGRCTGSRIDPLGILNKVNIYQAKNDPNNWTAREDEALTKGANKEPVLYPAKKGKPGRASLINHGNVTPSVQTLGVTCDHLEHSFVLSFAGLRRLRFGGGEKEKTGRSLLAALGLVALAEQDARGYALRSRCDLVCDSRAALELVHPDGAVTPSRSTAPPRGHCIRTHSNPHGRQVSICQLNLFASRRRTSSWRLFARARSLLSLARAAKRTRRPAVTLVLEIEYLSGVSFAAIGPDSEAPDWPPQPDRIFSALVASWAARGERPEEQQALEWLEKLPAPRLLSSDAEPRTGAVAFVPPNDPRSDKLKHAKSILPSLRSRQPRRFPATRPHDPIIRVCWPEAQPDDATFFALQMLARDTAYVGHSASLTRCRFLLCTIELGAAKLPQRRVYRGRLRELRQAYARFDKSADKKDRPQKGASVQPEPKANQKRSNLFGGSDHWLIFEHVAGEMPDIRACALVAKTLRDTLLSGYRRLGFENEIPEVVSGHAPDGAPTDLPHLAVVPLAFAGFRFADGHVTGFALVPPRDNAILKDVTFRKVLRALAPVDQERGQRILTLATRQRMFANSAFSIDLSPTFETPVGKRSLDPKPYTRRSQVFATLTPIALDRHLKERGEARLDEVAKQIARCCRNIGLPEPKAVIPNKHPAIEGAPSAYPSGKSPRWTNWRLPASLASRQLTHAVIRFAEPVEGPVILGSGRFLGLGLCRSLDSETR